MAAHVAAVRRRRRSARSKRPCQGSDPWGQTPSGADTDCVGTRAKLCRNPGWRPGGQSRTPPRPPSMPVAPSSR
jgi:hypothetical protein